MESESKVPSKEWTKDLSPDYRSAQMNLLSAEAQSLHHLQVDFHLFPMIWYKRQESYMV